MPAWPWLLTHAENRRRDVLPFALCSLCICVCLLTLPLPLPFALAFGFSTLRLIVCPSLPLLPGCRVWPFTTDNLQISCRRRICICQSTPPAQTLVLAQSGTDASLSIGHILPLEPHFHFLAQRAREG
ncbi:hypothetical protein DL98DRAFT_303285 [Cadophora sp. DSE1049]|nr:hypothetical protein DL98DRAFT_303285 [Cadophora sp. DSE1049]